MNSRERVLNTCERKGYDRIPVKHEGTPEINREIKDHFGLKNDDQMLLVLGDDFRYVEPVYVGPELRTMPDGSVEGYWGERYRYAAFEGGRYLESVYQPFAGVSKLEDLDRSHFPSADWFDYYTVGRQARRLHEAGFAVCCGTAGDMDFINGISRARGMEEVMIDLATDNPVYLAIMEHRFNFYYRMHERILEEAGGLVDFAHIGEDLGNQTGQMISFDVFDRHFAPKLEKYFKMVHAHGCRTMMHMCGTVHAFLPRLIALGLDVYDVVQPTTPENHISCLAKRFGDQLVFQGSMDVQKELAFGTPQDIEREVRLRLDLFPKGGLILGPSHAVQVGSPLENILAMYRTAGSLLEEVPQWVYDVDGEAETKINMSKLF
ncbi:MAG: uroporphyrinogen decarboxylase family protein [Acidobacteriota bacterium]